MKIPLFRPFIGKEEEDAAIRVLRSKVLSRGQEVEAFEAAFAEYSGKKFAIAVSSGTTALQLINRAVGWKPGDTVVTSPFSFVASANSLLMEGITPHFSDIDPVTLNLDLTKMSLDAASSPISGILLVHIFGALACSSSRTIPGINPSLPIIEDACEALFSPAEAPGLMRHALAAAFGFYSNKMITTGGEGGMIITDNEDIAAYCISARNQGRSEHGNWLEHVRLGFNYRMTELQAAIGREQLKKLPYIFEKRLRVADVYKFYLSTIPHVALLDEPIDHHRSWFVYPILLNSAATRDQCRSILEAKGIQTQIYFPPLHHFGHLKDRATYDALPMCEHIAERILALPFSTDLSEGEISYIANALREAVHLCAPQRTTKRAIDKFVIRQEERRGVFT